MTNEKSNNLTSFSFMTLWFGAAVSVAEIFTGGLIAPLGFTKGLLAITLGHIIGTSILVCGGIIGTKERIPALMSTRISFGRYGSYIFSILNVLQLIGWTAVMIITGARSVNVITKGLWNFDSMTVWSIFIGILVCLWIVFGKEGWKKLNTAAVILLLILTVFLSFVIFKNGSLLTKQITGEMSFGGAVELSAVMPLSWLPLIADYTRFAKTKKDGAVGSFVGYFFGSCWMYIIGLGAGIVAENSDPAVMMMAANVGFFGLGIVILATVTTTFMDTYSAGVTFLNIFPKMDEKKVAIVMTVIGTVLAIFLNMEQYENFLYAIGSVFSPLFTVLLVDYFLFKKNEIEQKLLLNWSAVFVCIIGTVLYYKFIKIDFVLGATVPVIILTGILYIIVRGLTVKWNYLKQYAKH